MAQRNPDNVSKVLENLLSAMKKPGTQQSGAQSGQIVQNDTNADGA